MPDASTAATVFVNGAALAWQPGLSVAQAVAAQGHAPDSVATALNGQFVARDQRDQTLLRPADQLTLFQAIVGG